MNPVISSPSAFDYRLVRLFVLMAIAWGLLGIAAGLWLVAVLRWPTLDPGLEWLSFGRLRPAHGLMMLYGFAVNALFAISLFVVQRTAQVRLANPLFSGLTFWGLQTVVLLGALANVLGQAQGGLMFDLPWSLDLLLVLAWLAWIRQMFATLGQRSQAPVYIANWFFIAFGVVVMAVQLLSSLALPVSADLQVSYPLFGGLADGFLQQWQAHALTWCLLGGSYVGALYYLLPRQLKRPLYSQGLAIAHFWALLPVSIWVGGSYLHWTPLPDWLGSIGTGFALLLMVATLAGPLNAALTLRGCGRGRAVLGDPVLSFLLVGTAMLVLFTVLGTLFALRGYSRAGLEMGWSGLQLHSLGLGWSTMLAFAGVYYLLPRIWETRIQRPTWVKLHLILSVVGIGLYLAGQWLAALAQAEARQRSDSYGNLLLGFRETLSAADSGNDLRLIGGGVLLSGMLVLLANVLITRARGIKDSRELEEILKARSETRQASEASSS